VQALNLWPDGKRPAEVLSPTQYTQRETAALVAKLPPPPATLAEWEARREVLAVQVREVLGVDPGPPAASVAVVGEFEVAGSRVRKLVIEPEPGIRVPMLLFAPANGVRPNGRLVVLLHHLGMATATASARRAALLGEGAWVLCLDLRGMGETRYNGESGGYMGFRDLDMAMGALKLGETLAGYWVRDLLAGIAAARQVIGQPVRVAVEGERETGFVAMLAAGQSEALEAVRADGLLASYASPKGYGLTFAYSDENNSKDVRNRALGGYGTMVPGIPGILRVADIPQLAALVAPRRLSVEGPMWASADPLTASEVEREFAWTRQVYELYGAGDRLRIEAW
jgi:hypothetical protein